MDVPELVTLKEIGRQLGDNRQRFRCLGRTPTWAELVECEPELQALYEKVARLPGRGEEARRIAWGEWCSCIRPRIDELVGFDVSNTKPIAGTVEAWDVVFTLLYELLPPRGHRHVPLITVLGEQKRKEHFAALRSLPRLDYIPAFPRGIFNVVYYEAKQAM